MFSLSAGSAIRDKFWSVDPGAVKAWARKSARRHGRSALVLAAELFLAAISYATAVVIVAHGSGSPPPLVILRETLALVLISRTMVVLWSCLYRRSLRYASGFDLVCLTKSVLASSLLLAVFIPWRFAVLQLSPGLFVIDAAFLQILWCGLHFSCRAFRTHRTNALKQNGRRTLVIGAGDAGIMLLREIAIDVASPFLPVAILDDDSSKWGQTICGLPVRGGTNDLVAVAAQMRAEEVLVCIPTATRTEMRSILDACRRAAVPVRTLPSLTELVRHRGTKDKSSATVSRRDLRPPSIEDLLNRDGIRVDPLETRNLVRGEVVLVTGAGGSIGSELSRQLADAGPRKLLLLDKSENGLFYANLEASEKLGAANVKPIFADVVDRERVRELVRTQCPSIIFHAAAHKHVAMMELYPREAIRNNVLGTRNVAEAAVEFGVNRFVNISTDKAVNPSNWMGVSKKLTELCIQELSARGPTCFSTVRFGNVAGSSGSVLRLFWERIERGQSVKVTDPRATRFFMSVPEAVHLILRAAALGRGGETFVFEMGDPVNICDLAKTMMLYSGLQPGRDLQIEFTGLQPGEKINEELWESQEAPVPSGSDHILVIRGRHPLSRGVLARISRVEELLARGNESDALEYVCTLFPDLRWDRANFAGQAAPAKQRALARSAGAA